MSRPVPSPAEYSGDSPPPVPTAAPACPERSRRARPRQRLYTPNFKMQSWGGHGNLAGAGFLFSGGFMNVRNQVSRRRFFGGVAATVGAMTLSKSELFAQAPGTQATATTQRFAGSDADYDRMVKIASNENNYGPPKSVMEAMNS